jgi:hypothetical protein
LTLLLSAALLALAGVASATPAPVLVEIDTVAERWVDARSARRLVPLELSDVRVPDNGGPRGLPVLFFRVQGRPDGSLRVELWDRGEYHGARLLSGSGENPQLVARRVALAAAELGRRLARKREATLARDERLKKARLAQLKALAERTQDGPLALRSELAYARAKGVSWLLGQQLSGELTLRGGLRLDVGAELWGGKLSHGLFAEMQGVNFGPGLRWAITPRLDVDLSIRAAALVLQAPGTLALDGRLEQHSSWTARVGAAGRFELGLSRHLRGFVGAELGQMLRSVSYLAGDGSRDRLGGVWLAASAGVVLTPP